MMRASKSLAAAPSDRAQIAWWLGVLCAALPLAIVQSRFVLGGLLRNFGLWRWVYVGIVFVAVTIALRAMGTRQWVKYLCVLAGVGYVASTVACAISACGVVVSWQGNPLSHFSQLLFAIFLGPWHIFFVLSAPLAGLLVLAARGADRTVFGRDSLLESSWFISQRKRFGVRCVRARC